MSNLIAMVATSLTVLSPDLTLFSYINEEQRNLLKKKNVTLKD